MAAWMLAIVLWAVKWDMLMETPPAYQIPCRTTSLTHLSASVVTKTLGVVMRGGYRSGRYRTS